MITEEMLRSAAAKSCEIYTDQLADGYDANLGSAEKQQIVSHIVETQKPICKNAKEYSE